MEREGFAKGRDFGIDPDKIDVSTNKLRPIGDQVVVKLEKIPTESEAGIVFVEDSRMFDFLYGEVIAVGAGRKNLKTGVLIPNELKVGETVILGRYVGADFVFEGETYKIMPEHQIYAVIEE